MSNTDDLAEQKKVEENQATPPLTARPLHRQFSAKLLALLLSIIVTIALTIMLFYLQSERNRILVENELTPLKQQFEQLQALQKAELLVDKLLFTDSGINFVALHTELLAVNRQLLRLDSSHTHLFQQWLNANKSASDIVVRIQQNHGRNEQLKQSSVIQLQLMWFSITPIISKISTQQASLFKQVQTSKKNMLSQSSAYAGVTKQLHNLQQLKRLLAEVLSRFEQLTIHTALDNFDLLRSGIEQIMALHSALKIDDKEQALVEFSQQITTFKEIVLTQQRALAKWQGSIRLAQSYQLDLNMQKNQLLQMLAKPQQPIMQVSGIFNDLLVKYNVSLSQKELVTALLMAISLSLFVFCYLLWCLRKQIKVSAQQSVVLITKSMHVANGDDIQANCAETQIIMQQLQSIAKAAHSEQEFQQLFLQCQEQQQVIEEQEQALVVHTQSSNLQQLDTYQRVAYQQAEELQRYQFLEDETLLFLQQQQAQLFEQSIAEEVMQARQQSSIIPVYEHLKQFALESKIRSESTVLTLIDVNLVDAIHAILMNKQAAQQGVNNQLYFSQDEQLFALAKLDLRLFQQLIGSFIDIALWDCRDAQLHLHLQLQDKSAGQQLVNVSIKVEVKGLVALPNLVNSLVDYQTTKLQESPLIGIFTTLFAKQHGENITAHLIDDGFKLNFDLPLAITSSLTVRKLHEVKLVGTNIMLLSSNEILIKLFKAFIQSASGQYEVLTRIDSFEQQFSAKKLSLRKVDVLVVASDVAQENMTLITEQFSQLPASFQPKLMVLQSEKLPLDDFGFYTQSESLLFKDIFLQNIETLLSNDTRSNQLLSSEQCQQARNVASELPVILAVNSPQEYQSFQRLLRWFGLQVYVVSHADAQQELWQTGLYCLLFTEFVEASLLEMPNKPLIDIAVFSLADERPSSDGNPYFDDWHLGQLTAQATVADLQVALAPWLKYITPVGRIENVEQGLPDELSLNINSDNDESEHETVITELVASLAEQNEAAVFDFSQYLHHQGSVELALFMLDDYSKDNHQQLDILIEAIKAKDFDTGKVAITDLQCNAKILSASTLEQLCCQWSQLLDGKDIPRSVTEMNTLLKNTRAALIAIDSYAESI